MSQAQTKAVSPPRPWIRGVLIGLVLVGIAAGGVLGWRYYRAWEIRGLVTKARGLMQREDYPMAILTLRRALQIDARNSEATRCMAELTDQLQSPNSIAWRAAVVDLNPGSTSDALAWANTALKFQHTDAAERALASVAPKDRNFPAYYCAAGVAAVGAGRSDIAERSFSKALELQPENELYQYNLAALQVQSEDQEKRRVGSETLERLASGGKLESFARRTLITQAIGEGKREEALRWSAMLQSSKEVKFRDRVTHLDLLRVLKKPELASLLAEMQETTKKEVPQNVAAFINWIRLDKRPQEALQWAETLAPELRSDARVSAARAECLIALKDWQALQALKDDGSWGEFEYARSAYIARAYQELKTPHARDAHWTVAISAAKDRDKAAQLAWMAIRWGWTEQQVQALWKAGEYPRPEWALQLLNKHYLSRGDTPGLLRVALRTAEANPKDRLARNNVAMFSVLLQRDVPTALRIARELHKENPADPTFASTYAFTLYGAGNAPEGIEVLKQLKKEHLQRPGIAACYAVLLDAVGESAEAQSYAALASKSRLLPEEKALLDSVIPRKLEVYVDPAKTAEVISN